MIKFLLTLLLLVIVTNVSACPVSKIDAADCLFSKADRDHDNFISQQDIDVVTAEVLPWYLKFAWSAFGGSSKIMTECDQNKDKKISSEEIMDTTKDCIVPCDRRQKIIELLHC